MCVSGNGVRRRRRREGLRTSVAVVVVVVVTFLVEFCAPDILDDHGLVHVSIEEQSRPQFDVRLSSPAQTQAPTTGDRRPSPIQRHIAVSQPNTQAQTVQGKTAQACGKQRNGPQQVRHRLSHRSAGCPTALMTPSAPTHSPHPRATGRVGVSACECTNKTVLRQHAHSC